MIPGKVYPRYLLHRLQPVPAGVLQGFCTGRHPPPGVVLLRQQEDCCCCCCVREGSDARTPLAPPLIQHSSRALLAVSCGGDAQTAAVVQRQFSRNMRRDPYDATPFMHKERMAHGGGCWYCASAGAVLVLCWCLVATNPSSTLRCCTDNFRRMFTAAQQSVGFKE